MIAKEHMMGLLMGACPSFSLPQDDRDLLYVLLGDFAEHLLQLQSKGCTDEFPAVAKVIERFYTEGDSNVREAATVGLLEGVQNVWDNNDVNPELFGRYLLPASTEAWKRLNDFWDGKGGSLS